MEKFVLFPCLVLAMLCLTQAQQQVTKIGSFGQKSLFVQTADTGRDWDSAVKFCQQQGMKLATIASAQESRAVAAFLLKEAQAGRHDVVQGWIGGNLVDGKWIWIANKAPVTFKNWGNGQGSPTEKYSKCMYISPSNDGKWSASYCELPHRAVCQK